MSLVGSVRLPTTLYVTPEALGQEFRSDLSGISLRIQFPELPKVGQGLNHLLPPKHLHKNYADLAGDMGEWGYVSRLQNAQVPPQALEAGEYSLL